VLIFPCTVKSRSSLLAPAHPGGPGKRAVKRLWCGCGVVTVDRQTDGIVCNGIQTVMQRKYMYVIGGCADIAIRCLVCLSVCSHISKTTCPNLATFSVHVAFGHGSVLLSQQCNMLCTSGFVTYCRVRRGLEPRDASQREATQKGAELQLCHLCIASL